MVPKRPNRHLHIFLRYCYSCNNFGHETLNCRAYGKVPEYKKNSSSNKPKGNHNLFTLLQKYDIECCKCNNHGHMERYCKLMTPTRKLLQLSLKTQKKEVLEGKGRKGKFHDFYMCDRKPQPVVLGQWMFKTYDRRPKQIHNTKR